MSHLYGCIEGREGPKEDQIFNMKIESHLDLIIAESP